MMRIFKYKNMQSYRTCNLKKISTLDFDYNCKK